MTDGPRARFTVQIGNGGRDDRERELVSMRINEGKGFVVWLALPKEALVALAQALVTHVDVRDILDPGAAE